MRRVVRAGVFLGVVTAILEGVFLLPPRAMTAEVEIGQVVVTATKTEIAISDAPQSISVITGEEILRTPDRSIAEIIQRGPGVVINQTGPMGGLNTASIRGSTSGQVLILLDGRRLNDYQNGQFDLSNLHIQRIRSGARLNRINLSLVLGNL